MNQNAINNGEYKGHWINCVAYVCEHGAASGVNDIHPAPVWGTDTGRDSLVGLPAAVGKNYP